ARQHPRASKRDRARGDPERRRADHRRPARRHAASSRAEPSLPRLAQSAALGGESAAAMQALPEMETQAVVAALRRAKGTKSQAAAALGLSRTRFYTLLRRYGLS